MRQSAEQWDATTERLVEFAERAQYDALARGQTGNAVSLALAPNMALAQSRRGHLSSWKESPMSEAQVERKFRDMTGTRLSERQCDALLKAVWSLEDASDVGRNVVKLFAN